MRISGEDKRYTTGELDDNGDMYVGDLKLNKYDGKFQKNGRGTLYYGDSFKNIQYEGEFKDDKFNGNGIFYDEYTTESGIWRNGECVNGTIKFNNSEQHIIDIKRNNDDNSVTYKFCFGKNSISIKIGSDFGYVENIVLRDNKNRNV